MHAEATWNSWSVRQMTLGARCHVCCMSVACLLHVCCMPVACLLHVCCMPVVCHVCPFARGHRRVSERGHRHGGSRAARQARQPPCSHVSRQSPSSHTHTPARLPLAQSASLYLGVAGVICLPCVGRLLCLPTPCVPTSCGACSLAITWCQA
jgi:hypothetical protein